MWLYVCTREWDRVSLQEVRTNEFPLKCLLLLNLGMHVALYMASSNQSIYVHASMSGTCVALPPRASRTFGQERSRNDHHPATPITV